MVTNARRTIAVGGAVAVGFAILFVLVGAEFGVWPMALTIVAFVGLAYLFESAGDVSTGFAISVIAVLLVLVQFSPGFIRQELERVIVDGLGLPLFTLNPVTILFWTALTLLIGWVLHIRFLAQPANAATTPSGVADAVTDKVETLIEEYVTIGRIVVMLGISVVVILLQQSDVIVAQLADLVGQTPAFVANGITGLLGFAALGGSLPIIGEIELLQGMSPVAWAVIVVVLILAAWGVKNS